MSLFVVVEILNEDGSPVDDDPGLRYFEIEQLKMAEQDRTAEGGYLNLDGTNYVFQARVVGVVDNALDEGRPVIRPLGGA